MNIQILKYLAEITPYSYPEIYRAYIAADKSIDTLLTAIELSIITSHCLVSEVISIKMELKKKVKYTFWQRLKFLFINKLT